MHTSSRDCPLNSKSNIENLSKSDNVTSGYPFSADNDKRDCPLNKNSKKVVDDSENSSEDSRDEVLESSGVMNQELWCICQEGGSMYGDMIECCNEHYEIKWFHLQCMSLDVAPKGDWFCSDECEVQAKEDIVILNVAEKKEFVVSAPLPTEEWKSEAKKKCSYFQSVAISRNPQKKIIKSLSKYCSSHE